MTTIISGDESGFPAASVSNPSSVAIWRATSSVITLLVSEVGALRMISKSSGSPETSSV